MKSPDAKLTRRSILSSVWNSLATAGVGAVAANLGVRPARAESSNGRAVVCIYLFGGNDANNMVIPLSQYAAYQAARGGLAIAQSELLPVQAAATQEQYAFHPAMPEMPALFQSGTLAVVANAGGVEGAPSIDPSLRYLRPGYVLPGWAVDSVRLPEPQVADGTPPPLPIYTGFPNLRSDNRSATRNLTNSLAMLAPGVVLSGADRNRLVQESATAAATLRTGFPDTALGAQLSQVAGLLKAGPQFGMRNQAFLCGFGRFATGANQLAPHAALLNELSSAMAAFYRATDEMGRAQSVTTYTDSEYGRTLQPNPQSGTDPAWGSHHLVMGGSVLGGNVYGRFPVLTPGGPDDLNGRGVFRPAISKDQYAATIASWFGLEYPELVHALPGITRHTQPTLGFLAG